MSADKRPSFTADEIFVCHSDVLHVLVMNGG